MTRSLHLELGANSYDIVIGHGVLPELGHRLLSLLGRGRVAVVTNETVAPLYLETALSSLSQAGFDCLPIILPDGEIYKNNETLQLIYDALIGNRMERSSCLVALGGGVIGDITGFAAASFLRGVPYVQVPTTLLSQVDSSVGGKTGINHPLGKNLIGAFYQPKLVLIDTATLVTLPYRQLLSGMAEVIKYGIIVDEAFFAFLEEHLSRILSLEESAVTRMIETSCALKAQIVGADEKERGRRAVLNLGHTFGHAIETLTNYRSHLHGEAVAIGMIMATDLSHRLGLCNHDTLQRVEALIARTGLPSRCPGFPVSAHLEAMSRDKKVADGRVRFVLVEKIGHALLHQEVSDADIGETIRAISQG